MLRFLSGDIGQDDTNLDGNHISETHAGIVGVNSAHIITADAVTGIRIDGLMLTGGDARSASVTHGGGVLMSNAAELSFSSVHFKGNTAVSGGAIYATDYGAVTVENSSFSGNHANTGGCVYLKNFVDYYSYETDYMSNSSAGNGGAIYADQFYNAANFYLRGGSFVSNQASSSGGGVYLMNVFLDADGVLFKGNTASQGGGVCFDASANYPHLNMVNCSFAGNSVTHRGGGLWGRMYRASAHGLDLTHCSFAGNSAGQSGGGIYWTSPSENSVIQNTVVWGNEVNGDVSSVSAGVHYVSVAASYHHSLVQNVDLTTDGAGNLNGTNVSNDPLLLDPANGDLRPMVGSSLIDAGGSGYVIADKLDVDQDGDIAEDISFDILRQSRSIGASSDIGAYEVTSDVVVTADDLTFGDTTPLGDFTGIGVFSGTDQTYSVFSNSVSEVATASISSTGVVDVVIGQAGVTDIVVQAIDSYGYVARKTISVELVAPSVIAVNSASEGPTNQSTLNYTIEFNEAVSGFDSATDLVIVKTGTVDYTSAEITTEDSVTFSVILNGVSGDGELTLAVVTGGDVVDNFDFSLESSVVSDALVIDNTAPVITLTGGGSIILEEGDSWVDPGYSALDSVDGLLGVELGGVEVNVNVPSNYVLTYDAEDAAGNVAQQKVRVVTVISHRTAWNQDNGLIGNIDSSDGGDPDADGLTNLEEFAFDANPLSSANGNKFAHGVWDLTNNAHYSVTFAARTGAEFMGQTSKQAEIDGVRYIVDCSTDLTSFNEGVEEVVPALSQSLPALNDGWEYRTFRIQAEMSVGAGFIRVRAVAPNN